nr:hypothetical protein [Micromonospora sp. DSM 115978]
MRAAHRTCRPTGRLLAVALLAVLWTTSVHGAASASVPAGAIATAHASVGAALIQQNPATGRADEIGGSGRAVAQPDGEEWLPPGGGDRLPAGARTAEPYPAVATTDPAGSPGREPDGAPRTRAVPGHPGRAPPA